MNETQLKHLQAIVNVDKQIRNYLQRLGFNQESIKIELLINRTNEQKEEFLDALGTAITDKCRELSVKLANSIVSNAASTIHQKQLAEQVSILWPNWVTTESKF